MKVNGIVISAVLVLLMAGCASHSQKVKNLRLGMSPDEARKAMGRDPFTIRAAKVFEDGQTTEVWEYIAKFSIYPKNYWLTFENGKLVQWGEPGDFAGKSGFNVPVDEYKAFKQAR